MADFSTIGDLPDMYRHCRDTEDTDLTIFEFFTEHVSALGQLIEGHGDDRHDAGDKPHAPIQYHCQQQIGCIVYYAKAIVKRPATAVAKEFPTALDEVYISSYISFIFRPPSA